MVAMVAEDSANTFRGQARSYKLKKPPRSLFDRRRDLGREDRINAEKCTTALVKLEPGNSR